MNITKDTILAEAAERRAAFKELYRDEYHKQLNLVLPGILLGPIIFLLLGRVVALAMSVFMLILLWSIFEAVEAGHIQGGNWTIILIIAAMVGNGLIGAWSMRARARDKTRRLIGM